MDVEKGDGDLSSGYGFLIIHTLSQIGDSSTFNNIDVCFDEGKVGYCPW